MSAVLKANDHTEQELKKICDGICKITGVQLGEKQHSMVVSRLQRRAIDLGLGGLDEYVLYFSENQKAETNALISLLTTHHTYFFREFSHFRYLETTGLAIVADAVRKRGNKKIRILSAACSRGQECYSLSMFMAHHLPKIAPDLSYEIVGTDVDPESVAIATNGVYHHSEIKSVPLQYMANHWVKGTGEISDYVKAKASIKKACTFATDNLLQPKRELSIEKFDLIFCRNVFIYFTPEQIKTIVQNLLTRLNPNGFLFAGISESLSQVGLGLKSQGPSIYCVEDLKAKAANPEKTQSLKNVSRIDAKPVADAPLRVLCVDDSPVILTILKKILSEDSGFKVVATATNGIEAAKALASNQVDVMTLDIHMPEEDGLTYLRKNFSKKHPAVVMLSSVSREDTDLAINCLNAGASDYVEKPAMGNMNERAEEIRLKLRCALNAKTEGITLNNNIATDFAKSNQITSTANKIRIMVANISDREKLAMSLSELSGTQPPSIIVLEGSGNPVESIAKDLSSKTKKSVKLYTDADKSLQDGSIYICDATSLDTVSGKFAEKSASILIYGDITQKTMTKLLAFKNRHILAEEAGKRRVDKHVRSVASDLVPSTSFIYMSNQFFAIKGR